MLINADGILADDSGDVAEASSQTQWRLVDERAVRDYLCTLSKSLASGAEAAAHRLGRPQCALANAASDALARLSRTHLPASEHLLDAIGQMVHAVPTSLFADLDSFAGEIEHLRGDLRATADSNAVLSQRSSAFEQRAHDLDCQAQRHEQLLQQLRHDAAEKAKQQDALMEELRRLGSERDAALVETDDVRAQVPALQQQLDTKASDLVSNVAHAVFASSMFLVLPQDFLRSRMVAETGKWRVEVERLREECESLGREREALRVKFMKLKSEYGEWSSSRRYSRHC